MKINAFYKLSLAACLFFLNTSPLIASIVEVKSVQTLADQAENDSLVLFNITNTLYHSETAMGDSTWKDFFSSRVNALIADKNKADRIIAEIKNKIVNAVPKVLVEPSTAKTIDNLQSKKIPVVGFTMKSPSTSYEENFAELVNTYLSNLGVHLDQTNKFLTLSPNNDKAYNYLYGIIFTSKQPKDIALVSFIEHIQGTKPKKILMVDSNKNNLESSQKALESSPFTFTGFLYNNDSKRDQEFDKDIGTIEFREFLTTGQVISDQEALQMKHHNPSTNYTALLDGLILKIAQGM